ncbi:hypothetical protein [Micromonospora humidisoli]|nr:hypothetical protein [Micromonospora humidisoli]
MWIVDSAIMQRTDQRMVDKAWRRRDAVDRYLDELTIMFVG